MFAKVIHRIFEISFFVALGCFIYFIVLIVAVYLFDKLFPAKVVVIKEENKKTKK